MLIIILKWEHSASVLNELVFSSNGTVLKTYPASIILFKKTFTLNHNL